MQFLWENHLNDRQIFGRFGFLITESEPNFAHLYFQTPISVETGEAPSVQALSLQPLPAVLPAKFCLWVSMWIHNHVSFWFVEIYAVCFSLLCSRVVPPSELKKKSIAVKEDSMYQVRLHFYVQREIVQGLKYVQRTFKSGIRGTELCSCQYYWLLCTN